MQENVLDKCPMTTYDDIKRTFVEELGHPPEELFAYFDQRPIASASLAQVHVAKDHDGHKLAVKVQHPNLQESADADIAIVESLVFIVKSLFPVFNSYKIAIYDFWFLEL